MQSIMIIVEIFDEKDIVELTSCAVIISYGMGPSYVHTTFNSMTTTRRGIIIGDSVYICLFFCVYVIYSVLNTRPSLL